MLRQETCTLHTAHCTAVQTNFRSLLPELHQILLAGQGFHNQWGLSKFFFFGGGGGFHNQWGLMQISAHRVSNTVHYRWGLSRQILKGSRVSPVGASAGTLFLTGILTKGANFVSSVFPFVPEKAGIEHTYF